MKARLSQALGLTLSALLSTLSWNAEAADPPAGASSTPPTAEPDQVPPSTDPTAPAAPPVAPPSSSQPAVPPVVPAAPPTETPPPAAPAPTPTPTPAPAPATAPVSPTPPQALDEDLRFAFVHLASDYPGTVLELRNFVDSGDWSPVCTLPCDKKLLVEGTEARLSAPGMTTSNVFRIEPGRGRALLKVDGGSSSTRTLGLTSLIVGIPVSFVGMGTLGFGVIEDEPDLRLGGAITLGVGAVLVVAALPLLVAGGTDVYDGKGKQIARAVDVRRPTVEHLF